MSETNKSQELRDKWLSDLKEAQESARDHIEAGTYDKDAQDAFEAKYNAATEYRKQAEDLERADAAVREAEEELRRTRDEASRDHAARSLQGFGPPTSELEADPTGPTDAQELLAIEKSALEKRFRQWANPHAVVPVKFTEWEKRSFVPAASHHPENVRAALEYQQTPMEQRAAQQTSTAGVGGDFIPRLLSNELLKQLAAFGGMRETCRVMNTPTGALLDLPFTNDVANLATLVGEATTGGTTEIPTGFNTLEASKWKTGPIKYTIELAQDSVIPIVPWIQDAIAERFGRAWEQAYTIRSSTEAAGPHGLTNFTTTGGTGGSIAQFVPSAGSSNMYSALLGLIHSVDPAYRSSPNAAIMMHDRSFLGLAASLDGNNRPLLDPNLQVGSALRFRGHRIVINQYLPDISSTNSAATRALWFGDFRHYIIRDVMPMTMFNMTERYINEGNFATIAFGRTDGRASFATTATASYPIKCVVGTT